MFSNARLKEIEPVGGELRVGMQEEQPLAAREPGGGVHLPASSLLGVNNCDIWSALAQRLQPELGPRLGDDGFHLQINRNPGDELAGGVTVGGQDWDDD